MKCVYPHNKEWASSTDQPCNKSADYFINGFSLCVEHADNIPYV